MTEDPTRLSAVPGSPELVAVLRAAREQLPDASALARLRERVQASVRVPLGARPHEAPVTAPSPTISASAAARPLGITMACSALVVLAGVLLGVRWFESRAAAPAPTARAAPPVQSQAPQRSASVGVPAPSALPQPKSAPAAAIVSARSRLGVAVVTAPSAELTSPTELELVGRAGRILKRDPTQALALASEHRTLYPAGALSEEREVIAIDALARLGNLAAARTRAEQFLLAFPRSAHVQRVERVAELQAIDAGTQKDPLERAPSE